VPADQTLFTASHPSLAERLDSNPGSPWLTVEESATYLKVKPRTLLLWIRRGQVKAFALSGTKRRVWRLRREDLDAAVGAYIPPLGSNERLQPVLDSARLPCSSKRRKW
jgi:excisionase family DNA binding protein